MSTVQNRAPGVDTVLLNSILVFTVPAYCVAVAPSNYSLLPTTVRRMLWIFFLCGLISTKIQSYVTIFPLKTLPLWMNNMVLFHFSIRFPTFRASLPRSLVNAFIHISLVISANACTPATLQWWDWLQNWSQNGYMPCVLWGSIGKGCICRQSGLYWASGGAEISVATLLLAGLHLLLAP